MKVFSQCCKCLTYLELGEVDMSARTLLFHICTDNLPVLGPEKWQRAFV